MEDLVKIFKALSDKTRLRIVLILLKARSELCICEVQDALRLAHYNASRHMRVLKNAGLVSERKDGKFVFYTLVKEEDKIYDFLLKALEAVDVPGFSVDALRLEKRLQSRVDGKCVSGIKGK